MGEEEGVVEEGLPREEGEAQDGPQGYIVKTVLATSAIPIDLPRRMVTDSDTVSRVFPVSSATVLDHAQLTANESPHRGRTSRGRLVGAVEHIRAGLPARARAPVDGIDFRRRG